MRTTPVELHEKPGFLSKLQFDFILRKVASILTKAAASLNLPQRSGIARPAIVLLFAENGETSACG